jgi:hypothetical protein
MLTSSHNDRLLEPDPSPEHRTKSWLSLLDIASAWLARLFVKLGRVRIID